MATRYIHKRTASDPPILDLPKAVGIAQDTDGVLKYSDNGTVRAIVAADKSQTLTNKTLAFQRETLAAAGTDQGSAAPITVGSLGLIKVTGADGTKGIRLPVASGGEAYVIRNTSGTLALNVYPATGGTIDGGSVNAAKSVAAATGLVFVAIAANEWWTA